MGNCHHRKYIPMLIDLVLNKRIDPAKILTQVKPMNDAIEAFKAFDRRERLDQGRTAPAAVESFRYWQRRAGGG